MKSRGFTLIELLVVVAIIAVLLSIMLPALSQAREQAKNAYCLNNLRQMTLAAETYIQSFNDSYPLAYDTPPLAGSIQYSNAWDFSTTTDWSTGERKVVPGLLWQGQTNEKIQQCPSYSGKNNWLDDPYTGYNYNTSYIGGNRTEYGVQASARIGQVQNPGQCALFGDGEYRGGANKFMRSPWPGTLDAGFSGRSGGTQGYRHLKRTNVAFADGHVVSWEKRCTETYPFDKINIVEGTGFLSEINEVVYDLE
ncbi:MAG: prepilin-type N-terminal cleavage/methylation domain-containing protein [Phycisphaerae bacterium]|jgi:prepilin-type N-terminal cleavage/methylation domain-containing protein/prepilin-type processing-associated H-X9-DG protein|nr:prepilin-type N-terminal cleavage/methylation domain-containing protein [Phycisphaerae bacterium]